MKEAMLVAGGLLVIWLISQQSSTATAATSTQPFVDSAGEIHTFDPKTGTWYSSGDFARPS